VNGVALNLTEPYASQAVSFVMCVTPEPGDPNHIQTGASSLGLAHTGEGPVTRFCFLVALMLLSSSAYAGDSFSFVVGGRRIHIDAARHCRSTSCASVSVSSISRDRGRYDDRDRNDDDDDRYDDRDRNRDGRYGNDRDRDDRRTNEPTRTLPPTPVGAAPPVQRVAAPPAVYRPAATATQIVPAPAPPPAKLAVPPAPPPPSAPLPAVAKPAEPVRPAPVPPISRVSNDAEDDGDTPLGDWQTEGKGSVRIAKCGNALCGYVLNSSSNNKGEAVLINMKPKSDRQWTGNVYSHAAILIMAPWTSRVRTRCASKPARSAASTAPATIGAGSMPRPKAW
jgi:hypothetical protein